MTCKERVINFLKRQPIDRIPVFEHFWGDTGRHYKELGIIAAENQISAHFDFDIIEVGAFNLTADMDYVPEVIAEDEDTITRKDGNGAIYRRHKKHDTTPEHIGFTVKDLAGWKELKKHLTIDERRINFEGYRRAKQRAEDGNKFLAWCSLNVFELMHLVIGHETLLTAMALEPELIYDMCETYVNVILGLQKLLFEREGYPDGAWYYEDLGFKERPFMSPAMFEEQLAPWHKKLFDYAHSHGLPVILHSCGFVEPLIDSMLASGIDCLQVIEVKAGMDLLRIYEKYGDRLSLMGGIDVRCLYTNDRAVIDAELEKKIPIVMQKYGYCLHSDHSIPKTVEYDIYRYFIQKGKELGTYR